MISEDLDDDQLDARRYRHLCDSMKLPDEFIFLLTIGASREILNVVIDKDMMGNHIESLN
jgi:hypothetical protein